MQFVWEAYSFNSDRDLLRDERWVEWIMLGIAEHQLQRMAARREFNAPLSLACAEMKVLFVGWDRLIRIKRFITVNKEMMVSTIGVSVAGVGDAHAPEAEAAPECAPYGRTILRPYNVKIGVFRRWCALRKCNNRHEGQPESQHGLSQKLHQGPLSE